MCEADIVHCHHWLMENLADKQKAIFISNISNDMDTASFLIAHSLKAFLIMFAVTNI